MKVGKEIRPYNAKVTQNGKGTMFSCQDSKKDDNGNWTKSPWYKVYAEGVTCHIDDKNPQGIKIIVKKIGGVTVQEYETKDGKKGVTTTVWADEIEIVGTKDETPSGFEQIEDEEIPF